MASGVIGFTGGTLDRADRLRQDPEALAATYGDWRSRLLRMDGLTPALTDAGTLDWATLAECPDDAELILLGLDNGKARFAALPRELGDVMAPAMRNPALMNALAMLPPGEGATYAAARSLIAWHARNGFCAACGGPTKLAKAGWARTCITCGTEQFPRVDPVVIMIAEHDGRALLGRGLGWPEGRYSALAGFVEPGESIEGAVAREVQEEAGVIVRDVTYVASQPWPFPSSLMIGCHSLTDDPTLTVDTTELEEARWFTRAEVRAALDGDEEGPFIAPPPHAVARHLLEWWIAR